MARQGMTLWQFYNSICSRLERILVFYIEIQKTDTSGSEQLKRERWLLKCKVTFERIWTKAVDLFTWKYGLLLQVYATLICIEVFLHWDSSHFLLSIRSDPVSSSSFYKVRLQFFNITRMTSSASDKKLPAKCECKTQVECASDAGQVTMFPICWLCTWTAVGRPKLAGRLMEQTMVRIKMFKVVLKLHKWIYTYDSANQPVWLIEKAVRDNPSL